MPLPATKGSRETIKLPQAAMKKKQRFNASVAQASTSRFRTLCGAKSQPHQAPSPPRWLPSGAQTARGRERQPREHEKEALTALRDSKIEARRRRKWQQSEEKLAQICPDAEQKRKDLSRKKLFDKKLLADIFEEIDEDHSGALSQEEVHKVFGEFFTPEELQASSGMRLNPQGEVELQAFLAWWDYTQSSGSGLLEGVIHLLKRKRDEDQALVRLFNSVANPREKSLKMCDLTKLVESMGGMASVGRDDILCIFREMDQDESGDIGLDEFRMWWKYSGKSSKLAGIMAKHIAEAMGLRQLFDEIDLDVSGAIDIAEFQLLLEKMGEVMSDDEAAKEFKSIREEGAWVREDGKRMVEEEIDFKAFTRWWYNPEKKLESHRLTVAMESLTKEAHHQLMSGSMKVRKKQAAFCPRDCTVTVPRHKLKEWHAEPHEEDPSAPHSRVVVYTTEEVPANKEEWIPVGHVSLQLSNDHHESCVLPMAELHLCEGEDRKYADALYGCCLVNPGEEEALTLLNTKLPNPSTFITIHQGLDTLASQVFGRKTNTITGRIVGTGLRVVEDGPTLPPVIGRGPQGSSNATRNQSSYHLSPNEPPSAGPGSPRNTKRRQGSHKSPSEVGTAHNSRASFVLSPPGSLSSFDGDELISPRSSVISPGSLDPSWPTSPRSARLSMIIQKATLLEDPTSPRNAAMKRTMSMGPSMVKKLLSPPMSPRNPRSRSLKIMKKQEQQGKPQGQEEEGPKRLLCMATETVDLQLLCLQQEGEGDSGESLVSCKLEADPSQVVKGYVHNPKVFCPCYLGKTTQQYIKPQAVLGFRYAAGGEMKLVCLSIMVPRAML